MAYRDRVLADSPAIYLELEETSGDPTNSGSETGLSYVIGAGVTRNQGGFADISATDNAWGFAGTNTSYVTILDDDTKYTDKVFTLELWVRLATADDYIAQLNPGGANYLIMSTDANGKAKVSVTGGTTSISLTSTTAIWSTTVWHHLVYVMNGSADHKLYVDGVLEASSTTDIGLFNMNGNVQLGSTNNFAMNGRISEFAVFNTALTSTQVSTHYSQVVVDGGYTAQASTASADIVNPVVGIFAGYTAQPMAASAAAGNADGKGNIRSAVVTEDTYTNSVDQSGNGDKTTLVIGANSRAFIKFPTTPTLGPGESITQVRLVLSGGSTGRNIARTTTAWTESGLSYLSQPSVADESSITPVAVGNGYAFDVTSLFNSTNTGLRITGAPDLTVSSAEGVEPPYFLYTVQQDTNVNVPAAPMLASGAASNASVQTELNGHYAAGAFLASSLMVDPAVSTTRSPEVLAEPMAASADMGQNSGFAVPVTVIADVATASADISNATASTTASPRVLAAPMAATARWVKPALVNDLPITENETDDPYFNRISAKNPVLWLRLNEPAGTTNLKNRGSWKSDADQTHAISHGVVFGLNEGPNGRGSAHFDGTGWLEQVEYGQAGVSGGFEGDDSATQTSMQFSFRTSNHKTQYLMGSYEIDQTVNLWVEIWLNNGRLEFRNVNGTTVTAFTDLADGEWHTVHIYRGKVSATSNQTGTGVYVDGKLEIHRATGINMLTGRFPDYIGGTDKTSEQSTFSSTVYFNVPQTAWFEGEMSEIVLMSDTVPYLDNAKSVNLDYYAFNFWAPIEVDASEAVATMTDNNRGKGNRKRALYLYWSTGREYAVGENTWARDTNDPKQDMDFAPINLQTRPAHEGRVGTLGPFDVFAASITGPSSGKTWKNRVTDEPDLIDLEYDVDLDAYDMIFFKDWPDESHELEQVNSAAKERLVGQILDAAVAGKNIMVTNPRLAVDLGVIDRVEWAESLHEGGLRGYYDNGSRTNLPWSLGYSFGFASANGPAVSMGTGEPGGNSPIDIFYDNYKNNRYRVRAVVEGLTDLPAWMLNDFVYAREKNAWADDAVFYRLSDNTGGLQIGDEFIYPGALSNPFDYNPLAIDFNHERYFGAYATPLANVKAGTVVTTFASKHWFGTQEVDNPYRDYATTIVVQPGDNLAGRQIAGRIFVNFTESPMGSTPPQLYGGYFIQSIDYDVLPDTGTYAIFKDETPEQREWQYSSSRVVINNTSIGSSELVTIVSPTGEVSQVLVPGSDGLISTTTNQLFPREFKATLNMTDRGLYWLAEDSELATGDRTVRPNAATASAVMPDATVVAERDTEVEGGPMVALAQSTKVAEDVSGDVEIRMLPMEAYAEITGYSKVIYAEPMEASAELVESFDMVHASGEQVVLYLHGVDATLYLKEEA